MSDFKFVSHRKEVVDEMERAVERALTKMGIKAERFAKALCPVDTGLLRNSITYAVSGGKTSVGTYHANNPDSNGVTSVGFYVGSVGSSDEKTVYIGTNVEYAPYQELGTRLMQATNGGRGYLRPAVEDHQSLYNKILTDEMKGVV